MNTQANERPSGGGGLQTKPRISLPLTNEIAAVFVGRSLVHPDTAPEKRAEVEKQLASFEKFEVVYQQNTADEMNIVVPEFPELDVEIQRLTEAQLSQLSGGDIVFAFLSSAVGLAIGSIGVSLGVGSIMVGGTAASATFATIGAVAAGLAACALVVGTGLAGAAVVGTSIGVGIAAATGAFGGGAGGGSDVGVGLVG